MESADLEYILREHLGLHSKVVSRRAVHGGSINDCECVRLDDGQALFLKTHRNGHYPGMYAAEALALQLLAAHGTITVPQPLYHDDACLLLEFLELGSPARDWQARMGAGLVQLHLGTRQDRFGFTMDNYLGTTPQPNPWHDDWVAFWREQRLAPQLDLFSEQAGSSDSLLKAGWLLLDTLDDVLAADPEPAVLLHGDLWSGNAAADRQGAPVAFDPASYYGHREAEFGMMRLFGGFGQACESAYEAGWPMQPEADRRIAVYMLHHQLNHLNLFGSGYYDGCLSTLKNIL